MRYTVPAVVILLSLGFIAAWHKDSMLEIRHRNYQLEQANQMLTYEVDDLRKQNFRLQSEFLLVQRSNRFAVLNARSLQNTRAFQTNSQTNAASN